jgi:hypothetical protein
VTILGASICAVVSALIQGAPRWILVAVAIVLAAWALFLSIKRPTYESHSETAKNEPTHPLKAIVPVKESEVSAGVHPVPEKKPLTLPEIRPRIVAVSYSRIAAVPALGFIVANDGEPAYEVSISDVQVGTSVVVFEGVCPRMDNRSSTEWRVLIKHDHGGFSTGNSLRDEMVRQGVGEIAVPIRYKDGNGLRYVSHCRIELNASATNGITVRNDGQELISGKPAHKAAVALSPTAPRPYLEVEDPIDEGFGKTLFHFTNGGGDVAHNIQVQPLTINHLSVVFDPISILAVKQTKTTIPTIPGIGIAGGHDILNQMEKEWDRALLRSGGPEQETGEWTTQITATYEDFARKKFEATMELVVFPMQRLQRNKDALQNPRREYKTVEVRNIKFRAIQ